MADCNHPRAALVWTSFNNYAQPMRVRQLRYQCLDCGRLTGTMPKHSLATPETPEVDIGQLKPGIRADQEGWQRQWREKEVRSQAEQDRWHEWYEEYLQSDDWWDKRNLVMKRANGLCEGCLDAPATQVHHHTYKHAGNEFMWELVAICDECHNRYHGKDEF